jgi:hypothetical protein
MKNNRNHDNSKKKQSKYHEKIVVHATYDEVLKMALNTPPKQKHKKAA